MEEEQVVNVPEAQNGDAPESEQAGQSDGLLTQDKAELSERVAHLEKRVREQQDEIACIKGAMADVMRRLGHVETSKTQNSVLPSKPYLQSARRTPAGKERPRSTISESSSARSGAPLSARQPPRGASAGTVKRWSSMSNSIEEVNGHKTPRSGSQLTSANVRGPVYNREDKCFRMYLKGRSVALYAPSDKDDYDVDDPQHPPKDTLELEWVYGYRGRDARSNLYPLPTGEVIYFSAAVVVLHNIEEKTQRHYLRHTDDVKCLAIHPDKVRIATGQVAGHEKKEGKPHVLVWDSITLETLFVIGEDDFQRAVCCVSFSVRDGGDRLLAVDEGNDHVLSIWDISATGSKKKAKKITETKSSGDPVTACEFNPYRDDMIVCCGKSQISFWSIENNKLMKRAGIFEKNDKAKFIICLAFKEDGDVISGDSNGNIYVWGGGGNKITKALEKAHEGPVFSICVLEDGTILTGGGKDRMVLQWDLDLERTGKQAEIPERYGAVRMISATGGEKSKLYVGTIRNCILQSSVELDTMEFNFSPVVEGHKEELWGLATMPDTDCLQFLTCGYDRHIYLWDAQARMCVWMKEIAEPAHCCAVYKYGNDYIAVIGNQTGKWLAIDLASHEIIGVYTDGKEQHECVEFSPDGTKVAFGNRDNYIYVYNVTDDGRKFHKIGRCSGHSSYVTHIDWSVDGNVIRSNSGDYAVLYWDPQRCKQMTDNDILRNLEFATNNCTLSFNSIGCWPDGADGTDINNCCMSHDKTLLASADDYGKVNLYGYPSIQHSATGHSYQGHSSHVTAVRFLADDSRVISTGGRDMAVLQWQVVRG